jgi:PAS domain S-box-containing protein
MAAINSSVDAVVATDRESTVTFANAAVQELLGRAPEEIVGRPFVWTMPDAEVIEGLRASRERGESSSYVIERPNRQFLRAIITPIVGGGVWSSLVVFHDLTDVKRVEQVRRDFVANVSHELRTPLTSIRGYLELLLEEASEAGIAATHVEWLNIIDRNAVRLLRLVEDLLLKAQDAAGAITLDRIDVDIAAVVEQCIQAGIPVATARGIALEHETEKLEPVSADPVRIGQVIDNLVSNALKFTPPGGRVDIRAFAHGAGVRIEVADTGVGIPEAEQERLFERFYRTAQAQSAAVPGAGLGLLIAKAIVEGHGGAISCRSADGAGTTFVVDLPLAESVASAA